MGIDRLISIMPPPANLVDVGAEMNWPSIDNNVNFPADYIDFINRYGSGRIANFLLIFNPFSAKEELNFFDQFNFILEDFKYLVDSDSEYYRYRLYPEDGGLIPFGVTDNGDYIFWVVDPKEDSNLWKVAIVAARSPEVELLPWGMLKFIEKLVQGSAKPSSFPQNINYKNLIFSSV
jgi:hypothetical protein